MESATVLAFVIVLLQWSYEIVLYLSLMMDSIEGVAVWILLELLVIFLGMVVSCPTTFTCMRRICEGEFKLTIECIA